MIDRFSVIALFDCPSYDSTITTTYGKNPTETLSAESYRPKACGIAIELAHIDNDHANNDIETAMPVCYDCHARIGVYNDRRPRGNKLKIEEIKARREQIYEKYTRQYIAPHQYSISQFVDAWAFRQGPTR